MDTIEPTETQVYLMDEYTKWADRTKRFRPSLNEFARWLGVSAVNLNHWINGTRVPTLESAVKLSERLGPKIYDVLGLPRVVVVDDAKLRYLLETWEILANDTRDEIISICEREVDRPSK